MKEERSPFEFEGWDNLPTPLYELLLKEAKERFLEEQEAAETMTKRAFTMLAFFIAAIPAVYSLYTANKSNITLIYTCISLAISLAGTVCARMLLSPKKAYYDGSEPINFFHPSQVGKGGEEAHITVLVNLMEQYQERIDFTKKSNRIRSPYYEAMVTAAGSQIILIIAYLITLLVLS